MGREASSKATRAGVGVTGPRVLKLRAGHAENRFENVVRGHVVFCVPADDARSSPNGCPFTLPSVLVVVLPASGGRDATRKPFLANYSAPKSLAPDRNEAFRIVVLLLRP